MSEEISIYVADLAAYNNGILHGVWIDATQDIDDIQEQINDMLARAAQKRMPKNTPFVTMKALQVIQYLNTKAFNVRMKSHIFWNH